MAPFQILLCQAVPSGATSSQMSELMLKVSHADSEGVDEACQLVASVTLSCSHFPNEEVFGKATVIHACYMPRPMQLVL